MGLLYVSTPEVLLFCFIKKLAHLKMFQITFVDYVFVYIYSMNLVGKKSIKFWMRI
jgi:hypothetical protein